MNTIVFCLCILTASSTFASVENLKQLYQRYAAPYARDWSYYEDIEEHREDFFKWIEAHGLSDIYSRVILTVGCRDADYIPKCKDAGKIFSTENSAYQIMHNGLKIEQDCYYDTWMTDLIYGLKGHHEPQEEKVFYEVLKQIPANAVMLELGSYWAYYSMWFAATIPQAKNYLVEPNFERLNIGKRNFALNGLSGTFVQGYLGECNEEEAGCSKDARPVYIDAFLEANAIEHVNVLHADIQGAEYAMLQSAVHSVSAQKIDYFFISTHSQKLHKDCIEHLQSFEYVIIAEHSPRESFSVDGLIVAKRKDLPGYGKVLISKNLYP